MTPGLQKLLEIITNNTTVLLYETKITFSPNRNFPEQKVIDQISLMITEKILSKKIINKIQQFIKGFYSMAKWGLLPKWKIGLSFENQ